MKHNNIVLIDAMNMIGVGEIGGGDDISGGHPKSSGASDDGDLPDLMAQGVPPEDAEGAAGVVAVGEDEVEEHHQSLLVEVGLPHRALQPPQWPGVDVGMPCHEVVQHRHLAELGRQDVGEVAFGDAPHGGVVAADDVVEVETEPRHLLLRRLGVQG